MCSGCELRSPAPAVMTLHGVLIAFPVRWSLRQVHGVQAFGNQVSSLVVLSLPEQHSWAAVTAKLLLIINASFNYQARAQRTKQVSALCARCC
jgi:ABC-type xylose transport system permease subunit